MKSRNKEVMKVNLPQQIHEFSARHCSAPCISIEIHEDRRAEQKHTYQKIT